MRKLLELVNLGGQERKYPSQISGGQQQRVALARALAPAPQLPLLDEPLSALDAQVRLHPREQLRQLQQELGVTTIMVTHDQDEALSLADRIVVMNRGTIEQTGTPKEVFLAPASPFVAGFPGDMNFLVGTVEEGGRVALTAGPDAGGGAASGTCLSILPVRLPAPGGRVRLGVRPPDIEVRLPATDASEVEAGRAEGIAAIETVFFRGNTHFLALRCSALDTTLNVELTRDAWHALGRERGGTLLLRLPPERLHIFTEP